MIGTHVETNLQSCSTGRNFCSGRPACPASVETHLLFASLLHYSSPKRPATAKPAAEVEAADDAADDVPTGGLQTKVVDQNRISVAHLRGTGGAEFEGKAAQVFVSAVLRWYHHGK